MKYVKRGVKELLEKFKFGEKFLKILFKSFWINCMFGCLIVVEFY